MARILLVEDEIVIAMGTTMALEDDGHEVTLAADGRAGLEAVIASQPDLVVTDYMMPRMSGLEMSAALRENGYRSPILLLTGVARENLPEDLVAHVDAYRQKPIDDDDLVRAVRALLAA
jgi:CheY-like chemotaxis protein